MAQLTTCSLGVFTRLFIAWCCASALVCGFVITNNPSDLVNGTFDYVVVGGGTAGLTIANRLTEDEHTTVLVIESGKDQRNDPRITDPGNFSIANVSDLTWGYLTTPQAIGGKAQSLTVGKALGGSSTINGMQWTRGTVAQYDAIEELGNPGWNFNSFQTYMKKAEFFHAPNAAQIALGVKFDPSAHGTAGRVMTGFPNPYPCPVCHVWDILINSAAQIFPGLRTGGDIDQCSGNPNGAARCSYSINPGPSTGPNTGQNVRSSSAQSFVYSLSPTDRPNLHILVEHRAVKILWDTMSSGNVPKARGVAFQAQDSPSGSFMVNVRKEVVVSSGTVGTPKFLELSGIGNKTLLNSLSIPVAVDLPSVGTNLQDQSLILIGYNSSHQLNNSVTHAPQTGVAVFLTLPQILGTQGADAYINELETTVSQRASDIVAAGTGISKAAVQKMLELQAKQFGEQKSPVVEIVYGVDLVHQLIGAVAWILLPQYRGTVHISSADAQVPPAINPNYLTTPQDLSLLVNASMATRQIFGTSSAKTLYSAELIPGLAVQTDDQWSTYVTNNYQPVLHPIGTASMLPRDLGGVVDANLRVYGVQGVRVADASILPLQLSAHLSSTVYGIAEKAADLINGASS